MKLLIIYTPYGDRFKVNKKGELTQKDSSFYGDRWLFLGLSHVKRNEFIPFRDLTTDRIKSLSLLYKNGKPQYTVRDKDHGTVREWGNTRYHGVQGLYWTKEENNV